MMFQIFVLKSSKQMVDINILTVDDASSNIVSVQNLGH